MPNLSLQTFLKPFITIISVLLCTQLLLTRIPGMEILGIGPNWLLIWVVAWSTQSSIFEGLVAGLALGLVQDGMTAPYPTHTISLALVGLITALLQKQRYLQEDFISVAFVTFIMTILAETIIALQLGLMGNQTFLEIWIYHQRVALGAAVISSLWAPVIHFPLSQFWKVKNN